MKHGKSGSGKSGFYSQGSIVITVDNVVLELSSSTGSVVRPRVLYSLYGVIQILRNHQGGGARFRNDYATVMFALSNAEFDYGRGRGSRNRQKVIT